MGELETEHRLTSIEAKLEMGFIQITAALNGISDKVGVQNGRISKLETSWAKLIGIVGAVMISAPFIFFALNKLVDGG